MATQSEVNSYLGYIRQELSIYGNRLANMTQQGNKPDFAKHLNFTLLQAFVDIADRYLEYWDSTTDTNFMTVVQFEEVMNHINRIAKSFHWLDLE
jgi:hypothetical protein